MKSIKKLYCLAVLFFTLCIATKAQLLKTAFTEGGSLNYLGLDFSKTKVILEVTNPRTLKEAVYSSMNLLIIQEPKKYELEKAFRKNRMRHEFEAVNKNYEKINPEEILSRDEADFMRLKPADIDSVVSQLDFSGEFGSSSILEGIGVLFVVEAFKKERQDKKATPLAAVWVTFIDIDHKKVLLTERVEAKATGGLSFRNYWASAIKSLIDDIGDKKYAEWKAKYGS